MQRSKRRSAFLLSAADVQYAGCALLDIVFFTFLAAFLKSQSSDASHVAAVQIDRLLGTC